MHLPCTYPERGRFRDRHRFSHNHTSFGAMPQITAAGQTFSCPIGANLRRSLLDNNIDLHNGGSKLINCRGLGTCGTCAVQLQGEASPPNWREQQRLGFPPHRRDASTAKGLRLACQTQVLGDITVTKFEGFWGQADTIRWSPQQGPGELA